MSDFTVTVELKGRRMDDDQYARLNELMEIEGFERKVYPATGFRPLNLIPHPDATPLATYFGQSDKEASMLLSCLKSRIKEAIQHEVVVFVVEMVDHATLA